MYKIKLSSIYMIYHKPSEQYYIGLSIDTMSRWQNHYTSLKTNKHSSTRLQDLYNKDNDMSNWEFKILEQFSFTEFKDLNNLKGQAASNGFRKLLLKKEKEWMKKYSLTFCLNKDNKHFS